LTIAGLYIVSMHVLLRQLNTLPLKEKQFLNTVAQEALTIENILC